MTSNENDNAVNEKESKMQIILNNLKDSNSSRFEESLNNPNLREEILNLIEPYYFDDSSNSSIIELKKFEKIDKDLDRSVINNDNLKLQIQLQIVSRKLSDLILKNSDKCLQQLQNVTELKLLLENSNEYCSLARFSLKKSQKRITLNSFDLLQSEIKKRHLVQLLKTLYEIKKFHNQNLCLKELFEHENYPAAIELCLNLQVIATKFDQFNSIRDMKFKLQERLNQIEESLDKQSSNLCFEFNQSTYDQLILSYKLLGKLQLFIDQFNLHFISALNNISQSVVIEFLVDNYSLEELGNKSFKELCELLKQNNYQKCLSRLCLQLWFVMRNYQRASEAHETIDSEKNKFDSVYIRQKYENGKLRLWQEVQQRISICFRTMLLDHFKFDEFMNLIEITNRLIQIGQEYCCDSGDSSILLNSVRDQTLSYFESYHTARLDEIKMFLENELWEWCPIKSTFSIMNLHEFKFLRSKSKQRKNGGNLSHSQSISSLISASSNENPFEIRDQMSNVNNEHEEIFDSAYDEEENEADELRQESINENGNVTFVKIKRSQSNPNGNVPIVTNTTLNLIRLFGKYLNIASKLKIISFDILFYMMQLFYYYLNYVILNFAQREIDLNKRILSENLANLLLKIKSEFSINSEVNYGPVKTRNEYMNALKQRIIISESLVFVATQLESLLKKFSEEDLALSAKHKNLSRNKIYFEQFKDVLKQVYELRGPIYLYIVRFSCDYTNIYDSIVKLSWDLNEIMSTHNKYVDILILQIKQLLNDIDQLASQIPINQSVKQSIVSQCVRIIMKTLVDGYSQAKKCSIEGRALMQLDFQSFLIKLEQLCDLKPVPDRDYVENYIKAFYLPDNSIEKWIKDHQEYTNKHTQSLISVMTHLSRKTRFNLNNLFEINS